MSFPREPRRARKQGIMASSREMETRAVSEPGPPRRIGPVRAPTASVTRRAAPRRPRPAVRGRGRGTANAETINVPGDFPTIHQAIEARAARAQIGGSAVTPARAPTLGNPRNPSLSIVDWRTQMKVGRPGARRIGRAVNVARTNLTALRANGH